MWIWRLPLVYFFPSLFIADVFAASPICYNIDQVKVTFYGYPDNSPVGPDIRCALDSREDCTGCASNSSHTTTAEECGPRGETAGGTGTYDDPITMASAATWFCYQEIIYLPYLQKYLRYEDYCADCTADAAVGILHIDIWTGSTTVNGGAIQDKCEKMLTPTGLQPMIRNPNIGLPVDSTKLFDPAQKNKGLCNGTTVMSGSTRIVPELFRFWLVGILALRLLLPV